MVLLNNEPCRFHITKVPVSLLFIVVLHSIVVNTSTHGVHQHFCVLTALIHVVVMLYQTFPYHEKPSLFNFGISDQWHLQTIAKGPRRNQITSSYTPSCLALTVGCIWLTMGKERTGQVRLMTWQYAPEPSWWCAEEWKNTVYRRSYQRWKTGRQGGCPWLGSTHPSSFSSAPSHPCLGLPSLASWSHPPLLCNLY